MLIALYVLVVLAVLFAAAAVVTREDAVLADAPPDAPDLGLPEGVLQPEDLAEVRFGLALRGYRMSEVDEVLERLAEELAERDSRIGQLEQALVDVVEPALERAEAEFGLALPPAVAQSLPEDVWTEGVSEGVPSVSDEAPAEVADQAPAAVYEEVPRGTWEQLPEHVSAHVVEEAPAVAEAAPEEARELEEEQQVSPELSVEAFGQVSASVGEEVSETVAPYLPVLEELFVPPAKVDEEFPEVLPPEPATYGLPEATDVDEAWGFAPLPAPAESLADSVDEDDTTDETRPAGSSDPDRT